MDLGLIISLYSGEASHGGFAASKGETSPRVPETTDMIKPGLPFDRSGVTMAATSHDEFSRRQILAVAANPGASASFYAAIGPVLTRYDADIDSATLTAGESMSFPLDIQYIWRNPTLPMVYLAVSDGGPGKKGTNHQLIACSLDPETGALGRFGPARDLRFRPLHLSLDREAAHLLAAYNNPSGVTVHAIASDGGLGEEIPQPADLDVGIFGHQVLVTPDGNAAIMPCRGYDAEAGAPERPGALKVYGYANGHLTPRASIEPNGGFGFGARHLDFHPTKPWLYLGVERQSELHVFALEGGSVRPEALFTMSALAGPNDGPARQAVSAVHVHPNGRTLYVSNRTYSPVDPVIPAGEDNIAVFSINQETGAPTAVQHAPTHGSLPRTFSIDASGRMLVAVNSEVARKIGDDGMAADLPLSLVTYRIRDDGTLDETGMISFPDKGELMFWGGFL